MSAYPLSDLVSIADLSGANGDYRSRPCGHPDELSPAGYPGQDGPNWPADADEFLAASHTALAIATAVSSIRQELLIARDDAKQATGVIASVRVARVLSVDDLFGNDADFTASINSEYFGTGDTASEALAAALAALDKRRGIVGVFGGFRVKGVTLVSGFPFRKPAEALDLARRIALDASYLDAAMEFHLEGVFDERDGAAPATVTPAA